MSVQKSTKRILNIYYFLKTIVMPKKSLRVTKPKNYVLQKFMEHFDSRTIVRNIIFFSSCLKKY